MLHYVNIFFLALTFILILREMPLPTEKNLGLGNKEIDVDIPFKQHFTEFIKFQQKLFQD